MLKLSQFVLASFLAVSTAHAASHDYTLTFDGASACGGSSCANYGYLDQNFGDVSGIVDVQYVNVGSSDPLRWWDRDYNDLQGVVWADGGDTNSHGQIVLKAENGSVKLNAMDFGAYPNTTLGTHISVQTLGGSVLFSYNGDVGAGAGSHNSFLPNVSATGGLVIDWYNSAYNVGVGNVNFTVTPVPEPETYAMFLAGLGIFGVMVRRKKKA